MREFLDLYDSWLHTKDRPHSPAAFRQWAHDEYCPAHCRGRLELIEKLDPVRVGVATLLRVRAHNTAVRPWRLTPGTETGVHIRYQVFDLDVTFCWSGRAGLFDGRV